MHMKPLADVEELDVEHDGREVVHQFTCPLPDVDKVRIDLSQMPLGTDAKVYFDI